MKTKREKKELVIEHITYDETHQPAKSYVSATASSSKPQKSNEQVSSRTPKPPTEQRPITIWPTPSLPPPSAPSQFQDLGTYIMAQERASKAARKQEKMISEANSTGRYLHHHPSHSPTHSHTQNHNIPTISTKEPHPPNLRRKDKFSNILMAKLNRSSSHQLEDELEKQPPLETSANNLPHFKDLRNAIKEGKLERTILPSSAVKKELLSPTHSKRPSSSRSAPDHNSQGSINSPLPLRESTDHPNPHLHPPHTPTSNSTSTSSPKKENGSPSSSSKSKKLAAYMEKGKERIQAKLNFHSPFEYLNYRSFPRLSSSTRKGSVSSSSSSDSSFCCIGEDTETESTDFDRGDSQNARIQGGGRRLSGEGSSPWYVPTGTTTTTTSKSDLKLKCRVCTNEENLGMNGLCLACERNLLRSKKKVGLGLSFPESESSSSTSYASFDDENGDEDEDQDEDEIKPTPPLKDRRTLLSSSSPRNSPPPPPPPPPTTKRPFLNSSSPSLPSSSNSSNSSHSFSSETEIVALHPFTASHKPNITIPSPTSRPRSQHSEISTVNEDSEEGEGSGNDRDTVRRWKAGPFALRYLRDREVEGDFNPLIPLIPRVRAKKENREYRDKERDTGFYEFWDEVLDEK